MLFPPSGLGRSLFLGLAVVSCASARAQLVCYEGFGDYAAGTQVESGSNNSAGTGLNGGAGWGGAYDVSDDTKSRIKIENRPGNPSPVNFTSGEIAIAGGNRALRFYDNAFAIDSTYAVQRPLGAVFDAAAGGTLWFSVLFRTAAGGASPLANQDFFQIGFDDNANASSGVPRVSIGANTTSITTFPADFQFFARSTTDISANANAFHGSLTIAAGTTYLLVGRIQPNAGSYDAVSLFVNPSTLDDPGPPSASITLASGLTTLSHAFIRTAYLDSGDAYVLDEWRIGRDYGSVVQSLRNALRIVPSDLPDSPPALRWPASLSGVVLETSTTLEPDSWTEVAGPFEVEGAEWKYPVPTGQEIPRAFFRLRR